MNNSANSNQLSSSQTNPSKPKRCVIYARKSHEEGLDQEFNSLDAQRESGEAYIKSQLHEHWQYVPKQYEDGGYSGGTLKRPALQELLTDIKQNKIDIIVVYKVDRLSRSLSDFAKLMDLFDGHNVSFVSVTQQFNTTSSMGRLTLNILLSFAQFEREMTSERIRDKFAQSKKKGMWMGGPVPLGYDVVNRKLLVNSQEARQVNYIYQAYLNGGGLLTLVDKLNYESITTKDYTSQNGIYHSGKNWTKNVLHNLLRNPIYIGKIRHKDKLHKGEHQSIVKQELHEKVQAKLKLKAPNKSSKRLITSTTLFPLKGYVQTIDGYSMHPSCPNKIVNGKRKKYRYYNSQLAASGEYQKCSINNVNAKQLEQAVHGLLKQQLISKITQANIKNIEPTQSQLSHQLTSKLDSESLHKVIKILQPKIIISPSQISINCTINNALKLIDVNTKDNVLITLTHNIQFMRYGGKKHITDRNGNPLFSQGKTHKNEVLINALVKAHDLNKQLNKDDKLSRTKLAKINNIGETRIRDTLRLIELAPDIQQAIIAGKQPILLILKDIPNPVPIDWNEQRNALGFKETKQQINR